MGFIFDSDLKESESQSKASVQGAGAFILPKN